MQVSVSEFSKWQEAIAATLAVLPRPTSVSVVSVFPLLWCNGGYLQILPRQLGYLPLLFFNFQLPTDLQCSWPEEQRSGVLFNLSLVS